MGGSSAQEYKFTSFDKCTLANLPSGDPKMWAHVISIYLITFWALWLLWKYSKESVLLRIMYIANSPKGGASHTTLVTDIPAIADDTSKRASERAKSAKTKAKEEKIAKKEADKAKKALEQAEKAASMEGGAGSKGSALDKAAAAVASLTEPSPAAGAGSAKDASPAAGSVSKGPGPVAEADESKLDMGSYQPPKGVDDDVAIGTEVNPEAIALTAGTTKRRRRFNYDLKDESLRPNTLARKQLAKGMTAKEMVEGEFRGVYPGDAVTAVNMVHDQSNLTKLVDEYEAIKQKMEDYMDECQYRFKKGVEVTRAKAFIFPIALGEWGKAQGYGRGLIKRVDAMDYWQARMKELDRCIAEEQPKARQMVWPSAFITFKTRRDQAVAATSLHQHDTNTWLTHNAPVPYELMWYNLGRTTSNRRALNAGMWALFVLMCLFFMIPVTALQGLIEVSKLQENPVLGPFVSNAVVSKLLEAIVPGLVLKIFMALVPPIITLMLKVAGVYSLSELDFGLVTRYYIFQVIIVFFGCIIAGSFFNQIKQWIEDPGSVLTVLGTSIPMTSTFFITYVWINGYAIKPLAFLRIVGYAIFSVLGKLSGSPRARVRLWQEQYTNLGTTVCDHSIAILLGFVFACINPIICPSVLLYMIIQYLIEGYQNIYVFRRQYDSGGKLWPRFLTQVLVGMYIGQITLLGLLGIKKFPATVLIIPVPFITMAFHFTVFSIFERPWELMSLHDAAELDRIDNGEDGAKGEGEAVPEDDLAEAPEEGEEPFIPEPEDPMTAYMSPVFKVEPGAIDPLLGELEAMSERVNKHQEDWQAEKAAEKEAKKAAKARGEKYVPKDKRGKEGAEGEEGSFSKAAKEVEMEAGSVLKAGSATAATAAATGSAAATPAGSATAAPADSATAGATASATPATAASTEPTA